MRKQLLVVSVIALASLLWGCTPHTTLIDAAEQGDLEKVKMLLKAGQPINQISKVKFGWTPLIAAVYQDNTNVAIYLIASGANVNIADGNGKTALMWAIERGDAALPLVKDLIAHGADVNATDKMGVTVFSYADSMPPNPGIVEVVTNAIADQAKRNMNRTRQP